MIAKPQTEETTEYMRGYVNQVPGDDLIAGLKNSMEHSLQLYRGISPDMEDYKYAEGKWSIKEVLAHVIDTERIFNYRALTFARNDKATLPGYDENAYTPYSNASNRTLANLVEEYELVRKGTICLFESFSPESLDFKGSANNKTVTARVLGWMTAGHDIHHCNVIRERYLKAATA